MKVIEQLKASTNITGEMTIDALMEHIPGPDFPTAGIINGKNGIIEAYRTGRGRIYIPGTEKINMAIFLLLPVMIRQISRGDSIYKS